MSLTEPRRVGPGKSRNYLALPGCVLVEEAGYTYEVPEHLFCQHCDGGGCRVCNWTGMADGKHLDLEGL